MVNPAKDLILRPEIFFQDLKENKINWLFPLSIYLIYMLFNSLFLNYRPLDFPNEMAALNIINPTFLFYFSVQFFWGTLFSLVFVVFVIFLIKFYALKLPYHLFVPHSGTSIFSLRNLKDSKEFNSENPSGENRLLGDKQVVGLPISLFSCLFSVIAFVYILKTSDNFLLHCVLLFGFTIISILIIKKNINNFLFLLKATFSINLILFLLLPILFLSVFIKSENLFLVSEVIMVAWLLILFVKTIKTISNISVLKIILVFGFSATGAFGVFYLLSKLNLLSDNTLKVLLSM